VYFKLSQTHLFVIALMFAMTKERGRFTSMNDKQYFENFETAGVTHVSIDMNALTGKVGARHALPYLQ
jgi:hypothetical protein